VVVEDIETDPPWEHCRHLALPHGLRACWSQPIFSSDHRVLGPFAMYVAADAQHAAIAAATISLAHNLRLRVVAEGVESEGQAAFLRSLGCEAAQGYLYSRPLRAEAVELLLRRGSLAAC
jgi:c-di-GMP-related signal transduction protein